ncbi:MAG: DUF4282 domain-containing protein [Opitutales bacterium]|nr:DUF4282 domain-containing protein [Opitutales bacterium]MCH8540171.1 DUF4282 domain-containing protein [Opitutales bacterium]
MIDKIKDFILNLFELQFEKFITLKCITIIYLIGMVLVSISTLSFIVFGFTAGVASGLVALILSPLFFLLYLLFFRVWMELIVVLFRIAENTRSTSENTKKMLPGS